MTNLPSVINDQLGLDKNFFQKYQSFDEKQDLYVDIKSASAMSSWMLADFFKYLWEETNEKTLKSFATSVKEPSSTINNYIRTAIAFPQESRNPTITFSHHFQASFADSYDTKTKTFQGNDRFTWLDKAIDEGLTTKALSEAIMRTKQVIRFKGQVPCDKCLKIDADIIPFNFYNVKSKHTDHFNFHEICYQQIIVFK